MRKSGRVRFKRLLRALPWLVIIGASWGYLAPAQAAPIAEPGKFLDQAEVATLSDHARFVQMLAQIHREAPPLSEGEQWHLRYLEAWEAGFEGDYAKCEAALRKIIDLSGDLTLSSKATTVLLKVLSFNRRYEDAFALANHLASTLPQVHDPQLRFAILTTLSQTLDFARQPDLAVQYARMAEHAIPVDETACRPLVLEAAALNEAKRLTSSSPELRRAIDVCTAAHQPILAETAWLVLSDVYLSENQPSKVLALLDKMEPTLRAGQFYTHLLSAQVKRAQAYFKLGEDVAADRAALQALAMSQPGDGSEWLMDDYEVLYQLEQKRGHNAAARNYFMRYSALRASHVDDLRARALAYDMTKQRLLVQGMEADRLNRLNSVLKVQQAAASKTIYLTRLCIALLILVLAFFVGYGMLLKRSQLRERKNAG